jgi:deazaflavin-dependent oxidoreductase (nitroreductase family)
MNPLFKLFMKGHVALYRATGGKLGGTLDGGKVLLLTTTGNKSGQRRTVPLMYFEYDGKTYLIASYAGAPVHPAWYKNLVATPQVTIEKSGQTYDAKAVTVDESERDAIYAKVKGDMPRFAEYEAKAGARKIPVVRIDP